MCFLRQYSLRKPCHNGCIYMAFSQCISSYDLLEHRHSLSVCIPKWFVRWQFFDKSSSQLLHWYGFSLVWILRCFFKITIYGEDLITLSALLKRMSIVFPHMYFKRNIAPFTTLKWFVPSVNLQRFQKMILHYLSNT